MIEDGDLGYRPALAARLDRKQIPQSQTFKDSKAMTHMLGTRRVSLPHLAAALAALFASTLAVPAAAGEFDDQCAMGLASGQTVKTDCSVNTVYKGKPIASAASRRSRTS
jgi:hypothetical protein